MALLPAVALVGMGSPAVVQGQVQMQFELNLPTVLPPLVRVRPGVRVVRDLEEEIFFVDGRYWVMRDDRWYRARNPRGRWVHVSARRVPSSLTGLPRGLFRNWHGRPANLPERLPPLVTVRPGIRIVRDMDDEVFFVGSYYWLRRDEHWFRSRNHRGNWEYVPPGRAPRELARFQPGQYRRWSGDRDEHRGDPGRGHGEGSDRGEGRHRGEGRDRGDGRGEERR